MSAENVKAFFDKVAEDKGLQAKLKAIADRLNKEGKGQPDDAAKAEVVKMGAAAGYQFTAAELAALRGTAGGGELSEDQLRQVAGGAIIRRCKVKPTWA